MRRFGDPLVYFAGRRLGVNADRLGSNVSANSYYPYGEEERTSYGEDDVRFATYVRDGVTGLDYAVNRYYSSIIGRFVSPDPSTGVNIKDPQTWNRYGYAAGDPVNRFDPAGTNFVLVWGGWCWGGGEGGGAYPCDTYGWNGMIGWLLAVNPGDDGGGGGGSDFIHVVDPSKTGPKEQRIRTVLDWINANVDADCAAWLTGLQGAIAGLEGDASDLDTVLIGHGTMDVHYAAFTGNNPNQTDLPAGYAITVNDVGSFFLGSYTNSSGKQVSLTTNGYTGGTSQAQVAILLHELAHFLTAEGFESDFANSKAGKRNDALVKEHCGETLDAAKNIE